MFGCVEESHLQPNAPISQEEFLPTEISPFPLWQAQIFPFNFCDTILGLE